MDELRREFDAAFARPAASQVEAACDVIVFEAAGRPLAIKLADLAGVQTARRVVALPGGGPDLLGLVGVRRQLFAVYSVASLLGGARESASGWLALARGASGTAFALGAAAGYLRAPLSSLRPLRSGGDGVVGEVLEFPGEPPRGILDGARLLAAIASRNGSRAG